MSKISSFARSRQGRRLTDQAMSYARSPDGKRKLEQVRTQLAARGKRRPR